MSPAVDNSFCLPLDKRPHQEQHQQHRQKQRQRQTKKKRHFPFGSIPTTAVLCRFFPFLRTYAHTHAHTSTHIHTLTYARTGTHIHTLTRVRTHTHARTASWQALRGFPLFNILSTSSNSLAVPRGSSSVTCRTCFCSAASRTPLVPTQTGFRHRQALGTSKESRCHISAKRTSRATVAYSHHFATSCGKAWSSMLRNGRARPLSTTPTTPSTVSSQRQSTSWIICRHTHTQQTLTVSRTPCRDAIPLSATSSSATSFPGD